MPKVIETNLVLNDENQAKSFQSRVIEVDDWLGFVDEIFNCHTVSRQAALGHLEGVTIPRSSKVENLLYDDFTLSCDVINYFGVKTKKLCYVINE
jgi:hypothetical protein